MGTHQRRTKSHWRGFLLIIIGFLSFNVSYFFLPFYGTTLNCLDTCSPPIYRTAWESSLQVLSHFSIAPFADSVVLILHYLPSIAALMVLAGSIGFIIHPQLFSLKWIYRSLLTGMITLLIALPFLFFFSRPEIGYLGMLLGYGLFFGGYRLFLTRL